MMNEKAPEIPGLDTNELVVSMHNAEAGCLAAAFGHDPVNA